MKQSRLVRIIQSVCCGLMTLCCAFGALALNQTVTIADDAARMEKGLTFTTSDKYDISETFDALPFTYEAVIHVPTTWTAKTGAWIGNYGSGTASVLADANAGGIPRMYYNDNVNGNFYITFSEVDVRSDDYVHVAMTFDRTTKEAKCYVNGALKQTIADPTSGTKYASSAFDYTLTTAMRLGGDLRSGNGNCFQGGYMKGIEVYSDVRTAEEIAADYARMKSASKAPTGDNVLCAFDLTASADVYLFDLVDSNRYINNPSVMTDGMKETLRVKNGLKFSTSDTYHLARSLDSVPFTYEAVIHVPTTWTAKTGAWIGNYGGSSPKAVLADANAGGIPRMFYNDGTNGNYYITFSEVDIRSDDYVHVAMTFNKVTRVACCYVNGELKQQIDDPTIGTNYENATFEFESVGTYKLGGDMRSGNTNCFQGGYMKGIEVYADARTAEEIAADYARMTSANKAPTDENILVAYDLTQVGDAYMYDLSAAENHIFNPNNMTDAMKEAIRMEKGMTFTASDLYDLSKPLSAIPFTYEAIIHVPTTWTAKTGAWIGNYGSTTACVLADANAGGIPRMFYNDGTNHNYYITFSEVDIRSEDYVHVAMTFNRVTRVACCYVNGELKQQIDDPTIGTNYENATFEYGSIGTYRLGGDLRSGNGNCFQGGYMKGIEVYSDARTAEEIAADYERMTSTNKVPTDKDVLCAYDLTQKGDAWMNDLSENLIPIRDNSNQISTWYSDKEEVKDYAYSFAVVGDPQYIAMREPDKLSYIYDWIVDNKEEKNIQHVFGLGDMTHTSTEAEFNANKEQLAKLDGVVPYSIVRGNHDTSTGMERFWYDEYTKQFGGFMTEGRVENSWRAFTVGETKYLLVTLDYGATDEELAWASGIVETFPDHKVIVTTHGYLHYDGNPTQPGLPGLPDGWLPNYTSDKGGSSDRQYNNGQQMWDKFISQHANMFLVLCGHIIYDDIVTTQTKGVHGNVVTQMLINPQSLDDKQGATGMVAMLYFSEDGKSMDVEWYSTIKEQYWKTKNQFRVSLSTAEIPNHVYDQEVIDEKYEKVAPTHLAVGEYYKSCVCGAKGEETFFGTEKIGEHTWTEIVDEKYLHTAATCENGGVYYQSCACGEKGTLVFLTDALGHEWEGNCDERHCTREGCGISSPINHKWDDGEVTKEAEIGVAGEMTYTCTREGCDSTKTEEIPALEDPNASSSEETIDPPCEMPDEDSSETDSAPTGGGLNCSGSVTGVVGLVGIVSAAAFVLFKKKED